MTRRLTSVLIGVFLLSLGIASVVTTSGSATTSTIVHGGGTGTFGSDLDGDGDIDGSQFAFSAEIGGGKTGGRFMCLMAGRSDILGLPIMSVKGPITSGSASASTATFGGVATVNLGNGTMFRGVPFSVTVIEGGPEVGSLQLTVMGAFDGVPGDSVVGNGNYDLPPETIRSGGIVVAA